MVEKKINVILSAALLSFISVSYSGSTLAEGVGSYPAEAVKCYLEQDIGNSDILRANGIDSRGSQSYEIIFTEGGGYGYNFNILNEGNAKCSYGEAINDYIPPKDRSGKFVWKLTNQVASDCAPRFFEVLTVDSNTKKYDNIPLPEMQLKLGSSQPDGKKELFIINKLSEAIEVVGFVDKNGIKAEEVQFEGGPVTISVSNPSLTVGLNPIAVSEFGKECKKNKRRFFIKYTAGGKEKTLPITFEYSCDNGNMVLMKKTKDELQEATTLADEFKGYAQGNATLADEFKKYAQGNATEAGKYRDFAISLELFLKKQRIKGDEEVDIDAVLKLLNGI